MHMEYKEGENMCGGAMGSCGGGCCGGGHGHKRALVWLVKIAILAIVFCFAFKMGELKGMLMGQGYFHHGLYGQGMMYGNDGNNWYGAEDGSVTSGTQVAPAPAPAK